MNRGDLRATLESYDARDPGEAASLAHIRRFLDSPADPFARDNPEGHITGSAIVARPDGAAFLLIHHRKLGRWLQPGGHTEESDGSVFDTALREAREETGIARFEAPLERAIFDVDVHPIPARPRTYRPAQVSRDKHIARPLPADLSLHDCDAHTSTPPA